MPTGSKFATPSPAVLAFYNAVPSVFWSVVGLVPLSVFCYRHLAQPWLYGFLMGSGLLYLIPKSWFRWWQLSARLAVYRRLGVPLVNHFTQHGTLINQLIRVRYPRYRHVGTRASVRALIGGSYHMERFHLALFVFFLLISGYAAVRGQAGWALLLSGLNVLYNLYPIWLQQYLRIRLGAAVPDHQAGQQ
ncbi:hypothetical protein DNI29_01090 [Hymenobacter sediminis]|uniref:glycosyl-4,4'-diaponeurosporenoate acyltransferase CrtO family protein n=1 Tax=Hymenobacter sediminis TaxID=2218621 RepID=UPI000DA6B91D|nr:hypothetical protein [Hymenobacter sediminis]RPD49429.1 hypothetical protein DNI29_01090 [Hymenobacter sediminis]